MAFVGEVASAQGDGDWADFGRYAAANAEQKAAAIRPDVVFMGNSITQGWADSHPEFFAGNNYAGRGIGGQVTAQILARFRPDVLELRPKAVVILAGTNDIARNQGFVALENIAGNIVSMAELARAHGIEPVLCSVLPAAGYPWRPEITGVAAMVVELNGLLADWACENDCAYVDFWSAMADADGGLPENLAYDGIHPTSEGYDRMEQVIAPLLKNFRRK